MFCFDFIVTPVRNDGMAERAHRLKTSKGGKRWKKVKLNDEEKEYAVSGNMNGLKQYGVKRRASDY